MAAVTVVGPEGAGKTTLAARLAEALGAELSGEAARGYAEALGGGRALWAGDVRPIALAQMGLEDAAAERAAASGRRLVVRDTDLVSTAAYAWWYYRYRAGWLDAAVRARRARHYLLCDVELPWTPDPARDPAMADAVIRREVLDAFVAELDRHGCAYSWVHGAGEARTACALRVLRRLGFVA